ncbi:MAG: lipoate--protein ligase family protein [Synechococcus sp.]
MAIDNHLLQTIGDGAAVRFYHWDGPWLSLGRHQRTIPPHWKALAEAGELSLVRRPSGGDAVLHHGGLTYALIWPEAPRQRQQAYQDACGWLIEGFAALGCDLRFGDSPAVAGGDNCFARATAADLIDGQGAKRIGSAQRWQRGRLLQHGEILLDPPAELWRRVFGEEPPPAAGPEVPRDGLDQHLIQTLIRQWDQLEWRHEAIDRDTVTPLNPGSDV